MLFTIFEPFVKRLKNQRRETFSNFSRFKIRKDIKFVYKKKNKNSSQEFIYIFGQFEVSRKRDQEMSHSLSDCVICVRTSRLL